MTEDILSFTQHISGIDLVDYVINYINQNMIIYSLLKNIKPTIKACIDGTRISYDISKLTAEDIDIVKKTLPVEQVIVVYGSAYTVMTNIPDNNNSDELFISIIPTM